MSDAPESRLKICVVSPFAYAALTGCHRGHAGDVEQQTTLCSRWLAARAHDVALITWDGSGPDGEVIDSVRVLKMRRREAGARGLRFSAVAKPECRAGVGERRHDLHHAAGALSGR